MPNGRPGAWLPRRCSIEAGGGITTFVIAQPRTYDGVSNTVWVSSRVRVFEVVVASAAAARD